MTRKISDESRGYKFSRLMGRIMLIAIGAPMAIIMALAAFQEIGANSFFGAGVCLMIVVFGIQLVSIATRGFSGAQQDIDQPDLLEELWKTDERIDLIRPSHAKIEIRGRE